MKYFEAQEKAKMIARLLVRGSRSLGGTAFNKQPLLSWLSVKIALSRKDTKALSPYIKELVLFGSAAKENSGEEVGDIDIMLFDDGFYSNVMSIEPVEQRGQNTDWYHRLRGNLALILKEYFLFDENTPGVLEAIETPVDLHVLPIALFTDSAVRQEIAGRHTDPQFFKNAFSAMKRYDRETGEFVPASPSYFEEKYGRHRAVGKIKLPKEDDDMFKTDFSVYRKGSTE